MDKRVIFAVAGAGKTTRIVDNLSTEKRSLIVTYTNANYQNLKRKINTKFNDEWPANITLMTYFTFLYSFCYKPFLSDVVKAKGIDYNGTPSVYLAKNVPEFYMNPYGYLYSNRIACLIQTQREVDSVKDRIKTYFDEFIIDEIQDIAGRDFGFLELLMSTEISMLFVGDFYQHTFDTSRDGNVNSSLFRDKQQYEARFTRQGIIIDKDSLSNSWRCSKSLCDFVRDSLNIPIYSNRAEEDDTTISFLIKPDDVKEVINDESIIKLHYQNGANHGAFHRNWGDTKGIDHYNDVCVLLNPNTMQKYRSGQLQQLPPTTLNKLYVALTRARGNLYIAEERLANQLETNN